MASASQQVHLLASDGQAFAVAPEVACLSQTIKGLLEDAANPEDRIPLPNVVGKVLALVLEYCTRHVAFAARKKEAEDRSDAATLEAVAEEANAWEAEFLAVDDAVLFDLILAANYLDIKALLDITCQKVATMLKGKSPEEIREKFGIKDDFTDEEREEIMRETQWAFD